MGNLSLKVASPDGMALAVEATCVEIQTMDGIIQVLPGHAPLIAALSPGELIVTPPEGGPDVFVTGGGFVEIRGDQVTMLTDLAKPEDALDLETVQEAMARTARELEEDDSDDPEIHALLELRLSETQVQMRLLDKRSRRGKL